jgi:hypothetical protein
MGPLNRNGHIFLGQPLINRCFPVQWYGIDFGKTETERLQAFTAFLQGQQKADLDSLLKSSKPIKVTYMEYNWSINKKKVSNA